MKDFVRCPKCEKQFSLRDWLVIGATHVIFDCKGKPTSRQATLEESTKQKIFTRITDGKQSVKVGDENEEE